MKALSNVKWEDFDMRNLDGNEFGWFGNGWTVANRLADLVGFTSYLDNTSFLDVDR